MSALSDKPLMHSSDMETKRKYKPGFASNSQQDNSEISLDQIQVDAGSFESDRFSKVLMNEKNEKDADFKVSSTQRT